MPAFQIAPSILAADFAALGASVALVEHDADMLHVDVMDGHFVPNLSLGPPVVAALRSCTELYLDCHLMMTNPGEYLDAFKRAGANSCTVHVEVGDTAALVEHARALGLKIGLALNPDATYDMVAPWIDQVDLLLCMTVFPGFGGQSFIASVMDTVAAARAEIDRRGLPTVIQVDGGIDVSTVPIAAAAGATNFVAGTAVFGASDPAGAVRAIRQAAASAVAA
ncbi:MAG TPA: ribulose-phosphate 3-epimerase [Acidimicrobiales bacterium]|nr:ribulose-phosphate 3-epimerase [Acidimicrobiales bacterium]